VDGSHAHRGAHLAVRCALAYLAWALPGADLDVVDMVDDLTLLLTTAPGDGHTPESARARWVTLTLRALAAR
jgi:hypothetical protein